MLKKMLIIINVMVMMTIILTSWDKSHASIRMDPIAAEPIKISVLLFRADDPFTSLISKSLEEIQKENMDKVEFSFFDGKGQQAIQDETLDILLKKGDVNLFLISLVDQGSTKEVIDKIKEKNIPVGFFGGADITAIQSYDKSYYIDSNPEEQGELQGKLLVNAWNSYKADIDKNEDNIMQYVMLEGVSNNIYTVARTKYSILTIHNARIQTQELTSKVCNWDEECARTTIESLFSKYDDKIEAIIANNDSMAIGAIKALQEFGYNKGDKTKTITVVGIDAIPEARDLIKKGFMTGSVVTDAYDTAKALYEIGMNLVYGKKPLDGTEYKFDETGVTVNRPPQGYINDFSSFYAGIH